MSRQKILAFLIAILPVAYIYSFPILINNLGHALLLFVLFPMFILDYKKGDNYHFRFVNKNYIGFTIYVLFVSLVAPLLNSLSGAFKDLIMFLEYSIIVYFLINDRQIKQLFIEIYTKLSVFFAIFLLFQYIAFVFFGKLISGVIPFLEVYHRDIESVIESSILRISSVFAEPSHFAVYVIPALLLYLFNRTKQKLVVLKIVIISIGVLLSTSSNGIIVMGLVYLAFIFKRYFTKLRFVHIVFGATILVGSFFLISKSQYINDVTYGLFTVKEGRSESKAEIRIYRGFKLYSELSSDSKIFGVGWRDSRQYCINRQPLLYSEYYMENFEYFNSIAGILIYSGLIGFILFFLFLFALFKQALDFETKTLIICTFVLMGTSSLFMSDQWFLLLTVITSMINTSSIKTKSIENEKRLSDIHS